MAKITVQSNAVLINACNGDGAPPSTNLTTLMRTMRWPNEAPPKAVNTETSAKKRIKVVKLPVKWKPLTIIRQANQSAATPAIRLNNVTCTPLNMK